MCLLSIKVSIRKKSGNLFNDPHIQRCLQVIRTALVFYCDTIWITLVPVSVFVHILMVTFLFDLCKRSHLR